MRKEIVLHSAIMMSILTKTKMVVAAET